MPTSAQPRIAVEDEWFRDLVERDVQDRNVSPKDQAMLRSPQVVETWWRQLCVLKDEQEGQARRRGSKVKATRARYKTNDLSERDLNKVEAEYHEWRSRAAGFKMAIDRRIIEARALMDAAEAGKSRRLANDLLKELRDGEVDHEELMKRVEAIRNSLPMG